LIGGGTNKDPFVTPIFGNPLNPWIAPAAQVEVHGLLHTFRLMTAANFEPAAVAVPYGAGPGFGGCQYQHAKIA
jgi:hypothetical protein